MYLAHTSGFPQRTLFRVSDGFRSTFVVHATKIAEVKPGTSEYHALPNNVDFRQVVRSPHAFAFDDPRGVVGSRRPCGPDARGGKVLSELQDLSNQRL
jgi:hypothetical protein